MVLDTYIFADEERSGTTIHGRTGLAQVMDAARAKPKPFDYVLVDDTSRFGRNKADTFKNRDILRFYKVHLYFVEDGLDSSDLHFDEVFHNKAHRDEGYSKTLSYKIKGARRERFLEGYNPGEYCFGYRNVPVEYTTRKGDYGRPFVKGVRQVVHPEEAEVVVRIFEAYAAGMTLLQIASMLNGDGVPTSQPHLSKRKPHWCKTAIREMLRNKRYIGKPAWGQSVENRDPETGKLVREDLPESQWQRIELPDLRIISDELFDRVQNQFRLATHGFGVKRLGGMTRTEASRRYLFSGILRCGVCGGNMQITTTRPARYGCGNHRESKTCSNQQTILASLLEEHFIAALGANLKSEVSREELVQALYTHLKLVTTAAAKRQAEASSERQAIESKQKGCQSRLATSWQPYVTSAIPGRFSKNSLDWKLNLLVLKLRWRRLRQNQSKTYRKPKSVPSSRTRWSVLETFSWATRRRFATNYREGFRP